MKTLTTVLRLSRPVHLALGVLTYLLGASLAAYLGNPFASAPFWTGLIGILMALISMFLLNEIFRPRVAEEGGASTAIRVDLLRRSGQAAEALKAIGEGRPGITEALILRILDFEEALIGKSDFGCHAVEEVLNAGR